jgi:dimethylargininase
MRQWQEHARLLREHGWGTIEAAPCDDCPDGVFVEDTLVMFRNAALITRPGAPSRRP